jgi:hypothetical protein
MATEKRDHRSEFSFASAVVAFVWLSVFAAAYNAITLKPPTERSATQAALVRLFSVLDDGDGTLRLFGDVRYTTAVFGIPILLVIVGCVVRRCGRSHGAKAAKSSGPTQ